MITSPITSINTTSCPPNNELPVFVAISGINAHVPYRMIQWLLSKLSIKKCTKTHHILSRTTTHFFSSNWITFLFDHALSFPALLPYRQSNTHNVGFSNWPPPIYKQTTSMHDMNISLFFESFCPLLHLYLAQPTLQVIGIFLNSINFFQ